MLPAVRPAGKISEGEVLRPESASEKLRHRTPDFVSTEANGSYLAAAAVPPGDSHGYAGRDTHLFTTRRRKRSYPTVSQAVLSASATTSEARKVAFGSSTQIQLLGDGWTETQFR